MRSLEMRKQSSLPAKVTEPILVNYHPRKRLFEILDKCWEYPVIWISGPAGCGKTTLAGSYLKKRKARSLWYQVDGGDADPATFFYYMRQAARHIAPHKKKILPLLTPEYHPGLDHFTMRYFEQLFKSMPEYSVIVLDNYQEAPETSTFQIVIRQGLSVIPRGLHVILISRKPPPPELVRLEANRQMATIGWNELRLMQEETTGIVELLAPDFLDEEKINEVHCLADGWVAGVVLMMHKFLTEGLDPDVFSKKTHELIFDYFASEVFERMDPDTQVFLLKSSFLSHMNIALAQEFTGNKDAGLILKELARNNYFVVRHLSRDIVYSYHTLFRRFLQERSKTIFSQQTITNIITEAASVLHKDGQVDEALNLISEAGNWKTMIRFLAEHAPSLLIQGRHRCLENLLSGVPENIIHTSPWFLLWLGCSRLPFDPLCSMNHFEDAYHQFKETGDISGFFLTWSGMANAIAYAYTSGKARVDVLIKDLEEKKEAFDNLASDDIKTRVAVGMFAILALRRPEHPDADAWAELALGLARKSNNMDAVAQTLLSRLYYHWETSTRKNIAEDIEELHQLSRDRTISELARLSIKLGEAQFYDFSSMHEQCLIAVETGLKLAEISGIHMWDTFLIGHAAMSCQNVGDLKGAAGYIDLLSHYENDPRPWIQVNLLFVKTRHAMICGNTQDAALYAQRGLHLEPRPTVPATFCMHRVLYAHVMHCLGNNQGAGELLSQAVDIAGRIGSKHFKILIQFLQAQIAFDEGRESLGFEYLRKTLPIAREWGSLGPLWNISSSTAYLCTRALEAGIETDYVKEIINRGHLVPPENALALKEWPWPVQVFTLGRFEILKDSQSLSFSKKAQKKPLELFKAIIALGGSPVNEAHIADILWPDTDGDLAMQTCATTLHRLRRLVGNHGLISLNNGMLFLDPGSCWVDAWVFEHIMDKAESLWKKAHTDPQVEEVCSLTCTALDLYTGEFLTGDEWNPDILSMQEHLKSRFFRALFRMGNHLVRCKDWGKALQLFEHGLKIDDSAEECYQKTMICLDRQGRRTEALSVFERCCRTLDARLGVSPSPETQALGRSLRTGRHP